MKKQIINEIIRIEGDKYTNDPSDSGGATKYGCTEAEARAFGYTGHMRDLPRAIAFDLLCIRFWDKVKGDDLENLSVAICKEVVDTGVNMGTHRASIFLQRCLNVLNNKASLYRDLKVDGKIGPASISALRAYLNSRDESVLLKALNCMQGAKYIELAERREKDEKWIYGWYKNRVE
jgi:lysozyme family protein